MVARIRLFVSSYSPLFLALAVRFDDSALRIAMVAIGVLSAVSLIQLLRSSRGTAPRTVTPTQSRDLGNEVSAYVATYVVPFVTVTSPDRYDLIAYAIVFCTLGIVYVNSDLVGVNPLLYLLGYRVFAVDGIRLDHQRTSRRMLVISRRPPVPGASIEIVDVATGLATEPTSMKGAS